MTRRALLVVLALVLDACAIGRRTPELRYYTLAVPGRPAETLDAPIVVGTFTAEQPYVTARFAYRTSPYRLDYYVYNRWAAEPRLLIAAAARDYLESTTVPGEAAPFVLTGHVRRFEEVDAADGWQAGLALDLRVERADRAVLARSYAEIEPVAEHQPEAVAAALSRALGRVLDRVLTDLRGSPGARTERP